MHGQDMTAVEPKSHSDSSVGVMARSWQIPLAWDVQIPSICDLAAYDYDIIGYMIVPDMHIF